MGNTGTKIFRKYCKACCTFEQEENKCSKVSGTMWQSGHKSLTTMWNRFNRVLTGKTIFENREKINMWIGMDYFGIELFCILKYRVDYFSRNTT